MTTKYHEMKLEEARRAKIAETAKNVSKLAEMTDVNLDDPSNGLSLKERISDLETAVCEIVDSIT